MNYYEELGVKQDATMDEIKRAYRQLAKKYHPDKNPGDEKAAKRFVRIAAAYEILAEEEKRKAYDASLNIGEKKRRLKNEAKYASTVNIDPMNMNEFENFFGFTTDGDKVVPTGKHAKAKKNPIDTSQMFEKFFGR